MNDKETVIVGIANREYKAMSYRVEVKKDGVKRGKVGPILLDNDQKWEQEVSFVLGVPGENWEVEFLLFQEGESESYDVLYLWLDVTEDD